MFVAKRACWHNKRMYKPGMAFVPVTPGEKPPHHFVPAAEFSPDLAMETARKDKLERVVRVQAQKAGENATGPAGGASRKP